MSAKDPKNAKGAKQGGGNLGGGKIPAPKGAPVQPCKKKHWFGVRVVDEKGKVVPGVKVKLKLTDGSTPVITIDKTGTHKTATTLDPGNCEVSFPDLFDAEWNPK
jgi:hypothetical protein